MKKCSRCKLGKIKNQVGCYRGALFIPVLLAEAIIEASPRRRVKISLNKLRYLVNQKKINISHTNHVNLKHIPILGQTDTHLFIIDGSHRAGWHLINKKPLYVYVLSAFETGLVSEAKPPKGKKFVR